MADFEQTVTFPQEVVEYQVRDGLNLLAAWRSHRGLTAAELAEKSGVSEAKIGELEQPGSKGQPDEVQKLADALGISPAQLES